MADTPLLECVGVSKSFGAVRALYRVDFEVRRGEVMALVGDNGAGKSTLIKSMVGIHPFDEGEVRFEGRPSPSTVPAMRPSSASRSSTRISRSRTTSTSSANMFLGRERTRAGVVLDEPSMEQSSRETLDSLSVTSLRSVRQIVAGLSGGQRQAVAVAKSVMWNSKLVILDEPTAALGVAQTRQVLDLVRRLAERGLGVVIVSHNLHDIFECADRITVLRLGQRVALFETVEDRPAGGRARHHGGEADARAGDGRRRGGSMTTETAGHHAGGRGRAPACRPPSCPPSARDRSTAQESVAAYLSRRWEAIRGGELGSIPIVVGLVVIAVVFGMLDDTFFTPRNFTNLLLQMAAVATIAIGIVFVLLIGEIDLSVAFVSAVGGVLMTLLLRPEASNWPAWAAIGVALAVTTIIGFLHAIVITKAGVPSFVVTLAGLLIWSGVVLIMTTQYSTSGTIRIQNDTVIGIANDFLSTFWGWAVGVLVVVGYALSQIQTARSRRARRSVREARGGDRRSRPSASPW